MRPIVSVFRNVLKPSAGPAIIFASDTDIFSKNSCRVSLAFQPIFFSGGPIVNPTISVGTTKAPMPLFIPFSIIFVVKLKIPATPAFVINIFPPFTI